MKNTVLLGGGQLIVVLSHPRPDAPCASDNTSVIYEKVIKETTDSSLAVLSINKGRQR